ncbi:MAG: hypothetical protein MR836_06010 [Ruminococcus sp.]|nr:hypothetical protein [Ruminococcus sp.]MDY3844156.1 hypothetical protein [Ruminococcus sp.]
MGLSSLFKFGGKYFDKNIQPKCDYCQFGKRAKDGDKVLCEKRGLVDASFSCGKFTYSPLKRIPVKQLKFVGSLADDEIYVETKDDKAEKEAAEAETKGIKTPDKKENKNADANVKLEKPQTVQQNNMQSIEPQTVQQNNMQSIEPQAVQPDNMQSVQSINNAENASNSESDLKSDADEDEQNDEVLMQDISKAQEFLNNKPIK